MSVSARVTVTLVIPVKSSWPNTTTIDEIYKRAKDDAEEAIRRAVHPERWMTAYDGKYMKGVTIVSMNVEAVMAAEGVK